MTDPQHLTTLYASTACYRGSFTFIRFSHILWRSQRTPVLRAKGMLQLADCNDAARRRHVPMSAAPYCPCSVYRPNTSSFYATEMGTRYNGSVFCSGTMQRIGIAAVAMLCLVAAPGDLHTIRRPSFIGCVDSSDCREEQCCVLGSYPGLTNAP
jgi:hypothetical protein